MMNNAVFFLLKMRMVLYFMFEMHNGVRCCICIKEVLQRLK